MAGKFPKMKPGDLVRYALVCAINDRQSFADSYPAGAEERAEALDDVRQFRAYMRRRFGTSQTPIEQALEGVPSVPLQQLASSKADTP